MTGRIGIDKFRDEEGRLDHTREDYQEWMREHSDEPPETWADDFTTPDDLERRERLSHRPAHADYVGAMADDE